MNQQFRLGVQHLLHQEYDRAATAFGRILQDDPSDARAWSNYGLALTHLGKAAEAEMALSKAVALAPKNGEAWFHLGVVRALRDEWSDAASAYRRAVALEPTDMIAWHRLGVALAEAGDEPSASVAFERALVLSRDVPTAAAMPTAALPRADDHSLEGAEREGAREAKSWLDLALSLLALGDEDEAIAAYERAFTLDPERAARSLFRPMLRLLATVGEEGGATQAEPALPPGGPPRPEAVRPPRRPEVG
ncbi:MAG TPA: tetratricopeptide repeat protein [Thermoplasmata archaeon]|nr:tetratricopeptide repeat protein [Thermoplasmata archaeon]